MGPVSKLDDAFLILERHWRRALRALVRGPLLLPPPDYLDATMGRIAAVLARKQEGPAHLAASLSRALRPLGVAFLVRRKLAAHGMKYLCGSTILRRTGTIAIEVSRHGLLSEPDVAAFLQECFALMAHESIHRMQRFAIGSSRYAKRLSGHDCARLYLDQYNGPVDERRRRRAMRLYLSDPLEIMAHSFDLGREWRLNQPNGIKLRRAAYLRTETWQKFRGAGFREDGIVMRVLLALAIRYAAHLQSVKYTSLYRGEIVSSC